MAEAEEEAAAPYATVGEPAADSVEGEYAAEEGSVAEGEEGAGAAAAAAAAAYSWPQLRFDLPPRRLYHFARQFRSPRSSSAGNFLKGVKWSPDGSSFLTSSDDNSLRLFYLPEDAYSAATEHTAEAAVSGEDSYGASVQVNEGEPAYDFCWYPYMSVSDPGTCVFASTSRDHPIHLWDATTGELRCTYRAYDAMDEIAAALSISFNSTGAKLFAGYNKAIRVFDVHRPGRDFEQYSLLKGGEGPTARQQLFMQRVTWSHYMFYMASLEVLHRYFFQKMETIYTLEDARIHTYYVGTFATLWTLFTSCTDRVILLIKEYNLILNPVANILLLVGRMAWSMFTTFKVVNG